MPVQWPAELFQVETPFAPLQLSPYDSRYLGEALDDSSDDGLPSDAEWQSHFPGRYESYRLTFNGRTALASALEEIRPTPDEDVVIVTTTGSPYISSCVTREIEKVCRWTRVAGPRTRAALIIHEFGFPAKLPTGISGKMPIIEDCAWACVGAGPDGQMGKLGDHVIYSFPKAWPMPFGGLLKSRQPLRADTASKPLSDGAVKVLLRGLRSNLPRRETLVERRRENYARYETLFAASGFSAYFELLPEIVPHVFVFRLADEVRAKRAKGFMMAAGIESTVFFGAGGYYLPNHQGMSALDVEYLHRRFMDAWNRAA